MTSEKQQNQIFRLIKELACDCKGFRLNAEINGNISQESDSGIRVTQLARLRYGVRRQCQRVF